MEIEKKDGKGEKEKTREREIRQKIVNPAVFCCSFLTLSFPVQRWGPESFFCRPHLYTVQVPGIHRAQMPFP